MNEQKEENTSSPSSTPSLKEQEQKNNVKEQTPFLKRKISFFQRHGKKRIQENNLRTKLRNAKRAYKNFMLDHSKVKFTAEAAVMTFLEFLSAFLFAYGFRSFIAPIGSTKLVSGGASGISQVISKIFELAGSHFDEVSLQSIFYFVINVPLIILGFLAVGKKFTFWSMVNVGFSSLLIKVIPESWTEIIQLKEDTLARALAGGLCTGLSSGLALRIGTSTGGVDIISLYVAEKKHTSVGKYYLIINTITVLTYTLLSCFKNQNGILVGDPENGKIQATLALYTIVYFFICSHVIDILNTKNKKVQLQIITTYPDMQKVLIHGFPHSCTIVDAKGGFTGANVKVIYMIVSKSEGKKVVEVVRQVDPKSFISVQNNDFVFGNFYIKPID